MQPVGFCDVARVFFTTHISENGRLEGFANQCLSVTQQEKILLIRDENLGRTLYHMKKLESSSIFSLFLFPLGTLLKLVAWLHSPTRENNFFYIRERYEEKEAHKLPYFKNGLDEETLPPFAALPQDLFKKLIISLDIPSMKALRLVATSFAKSTWLAKIILHKRSGYPDSWEERIAEAEWEKIPFYPLPSRFTFPDYDVLKAIQKEDFQSGSILRGVKWGTPFIALKHEAGVALWLKVDGVWKNGFAFADKGNVGQVIKDEAKFLSLLKASL